MITAIDLAVPNKTESLSYLDGNNTSPDRFAVASIMFNADVQPYLEDWIVGPLPISNASTAQPYSFRSTKGSSRVRNRDADADKVSEFVKTITDPMDDVVEYLLGAKSETFDIWGIVRAPFPSSPSSLPLLSLLCRARLLASALTIESTEADMLCHCDVGSSLVRTGPQGRNQIAYDQLERLLGDT